MLHIIAGNPGGGKTYLACERILNEIGVTDRTVVTNMTLNLDRFQEYASEQFPNKDIDIATRIRPITDEQAKRFFLHRPFGYSIPQITEEQEKKGETFDLDNCELVDARYADHIEALSGTLPKTAKTSKLGGVLYVIDEAHLYFSARGYRDFTRLAEFYLSQHRKFGDDIIAVTQFPDKLDKNFRSLAQDVTICRNASMEKMQWIRGPNGFLRMKYLAVAGSRSQKPQETTFQKFKFHTIGTLYETSAGVGIMERSEADTKTVKAKGLHWSWLIIAIFLGMSAIVAVPMMLGKNGLNKVASASRYESPDPPIPGQQNQLPQEQNQLPQDQNQLTEQQKQQLQKLAPSPAVRVTATRKVPAQYENPFRPASEKEEGEKVRLKGVYIDKAKKQWSVYLTDGRVYSTGDEQVTYITANTVVVDGIKYTK
jgi:hypothetical protein